MPAGLVIEVRRDVCKVWSTSSQRVVVYDASDLPNDVERGDWLEIRLNDAGQLAHISLSDRQILKVRKMDNAIAVLDWFLLDVPAPQAVDDEDDSPVFAFSPRLGFIPLTRRFRLPHITKGMAYKLYAEIDGNETWKIFDQTTLDTVDERDRIDGDIVHKLENAMKDATSKGNMKSPSLQWVSPDDRSDSSRYNNNPRDKDHLPPSTKHHREDHDEFEDRAPVLGEWVKIIMTGSYENMYFASSPHGDIAILRECHNYDPRIENSKGKIFRAMIRRDTNDMSKNSLFATEIDLEEMNPPHGVIVTDRTYPQLECPVKVSKVDGNEVDVLSPFVGPAFLSNKFRCSIHIDFRVGQWLRVQLTRARKGETRGSFISHWVVIAVDSEIKNNYTPVEPERVLSSMDHSNNLSDMPLSIKLHEQTVTTIIVTKADREKYIAFGSTPFYHEYGDAIIVARSMLSNSRLEKGTVFRAVVKADRKLDGRASLFTCDLEDSPILLPKDLTINVDALNLEVWCTVHVLDTDMNGKPSSLFSPLIGLLHMDQEIVNGIICHRGGFLRTRVVHHGKKGWVIAEVREANRPPLPLLPSQKQHDELRGEYYPQQGRGGSEREEDHTEVQHFENLRTGEQRDTWIIITNMVKSLAFASTLYGDAIIMRECLAKSNNVDRGQIYRGVVKCEDIPSSKVRHRILQMDADPFVPPSDVDVCATLYDMTVTCVVRVEKMNLDGTVWLWSTLVGRAAVDYSGALRDYNFRAGDFLRVRLTRIYKYIEKYPAPWMAIEVIGSCAPSLPLLMNSEAEGQNHHDTWKDEFDVDRRSIDGPHSLIPKKNSSIPTTDSWETSSARSAKNNDESRQNDGWTAVLITILLPCGKFFATFPDGDLHGHAESFSNPSDVKALRPGIIVHAKYRSFMRDGTLMHSILDIDPRPLSPPDGIRIELNRKGLPEVTCTMCVQSRSSTFFILYNDAIGPASLPIENAPPRTETGDCLHVVIFRIGNRGEYASNWLVSRQHPIEKVRQEREEARYEDDHRMNQNRGRALEMNSERYEDTRSTGRSEGRGDRRMDSFVGSLLEMDSVREALEREGRLHEMERMLEQQRQHRQ